MNAVVTHSWKHVLRGTEAWPSTLDLLGKGSPSSLWVRGSLPDGPTLAIVGTRSPDLSGIDSARRLARAAAREGMAVVSGGALGIDTAGHEACMAAGGRTVVVMATGPDIVYPPANYALFDRIVESGGAIATEYPPGTTVSRGRFLSRNRILAALAACGGVVVVQARHRSGALSTAAWARKLGVRVYAVPGSPLSALSDGTNRLIETGRAVIVTRTDVTPGSSGRVTPRPADRPRPEDESSSPDDSPGPDEVIERLLGTVPAPLDSILEESGLSLADASRALVDLELEGRAILAGHAGWIRGRPSRPSRPGLTDADIGCNRAIPRGRPDGD